jgi:hypothetical protein
MTRGRDHNYAYIYTREDGEADHEHRRLLTDDDVHQVGRGTKHAAAHYLRMILAMTIARSPCMPWLNAPRKHQLRRVVANLLARNEQRRAHPTRNLAPTLHEVSLQRITVLLGAL